MLRRPGLNRSRSTHQSKHWTISTLEKRLMLAGDVGAAVAPVDAACLADATCPGAMADGNSQSSSPHLVIIDANVTIEGVLLDAIPAGAEIAVLDADRDGVQQISSLLATRQNLQSVHVLSHGSEARLQLGNLSLTPENLDQYRTQIAGWGQAMVSGGDLLLYGCNVAEGPNGQAFLQQLAALTGLDVAASTDRTASASKSLGNWELEWRQGQIEHAQLLAADALNRYDGSLGITESGLRLNGAASVTAEELWLTTTAARQAGTAFLETPIEVDDTTSFHTEFSFVISGGSGSQGADGLAFLLQNSSAGPDAIGLIGGYLGYGGITSSLAIEFDTHRNANDLSANTISVVINGNPLEVARAQTSVPFELNDGTEYHAWIDYDGETNLLEVYLSASADKPAVASLSTEVDLGQIVGRSAYVGFSAASYDSPNFHRINTWSFASDVAQPRPGDLVLATDQVRVLEGGGSITLNVQRVGGSAGDVSVSYVTVGNSAIVGEDFVGKSGQLLFADGETSKQITIQILDDDQQEVSEQFRVELRDPVNTTLRNPQVAVVTIADDDAGLPSFASFDAATGLHLNGSANLAGGELQLTGTVAQQAGTAFFETPIAIDDATSFLSEFSFRIGGSSGGAGADGLVFLMQNSSAGVEALGRAGGYLGYDGIDRSLAIEFDTYRNGSDVAVNSIAVVMNGTPLGSAWAQSAVPYDLNDGRQYHAWVQYNGESNLLEVYLSDSAIRPVAPTLTTELDLAQIVGESAYAGFAAGNYNQPDAHRVSTWNLSVQAPPPRAGSFALVTSKFNVIESQGAVTLEVQRLGGSAGDAWVDYFTAKESALPGEDFVQQSGQLHFADGETSKRFTIQIVDDGDSEPTEEFSVRLDNPIGADLLTPRTSLITILDDDSDLPIYPSFESGFGLSLNGSAAIAAGELQLTDTGTQRAGTAFFEAPIVVDGSTSFQSAFSFRIGGGSGVTGADGMTFLLQNSPDGLDGLGRPGGYLGYDNLVNSIAIEFDTYRNGWDSSNNAVALVINGELDNALVEVESPFDLNDGNQYYAWIDYNGESNVLAVYLSDSPDKPLFAMLRANLALDQIVGNVAFAGFSAANYNQPNYHVVSSWSFSLDEPPLDPAFNPTGEVVAQNIYTGLIQPLAVQWSPDGRNLYIAEKGGVIRVARDGAATPSVLLDISNQVNNVQDRGLIDFALHPDFENNGYVYLLYTYDPPEVYDNVGHSYAGPDGRGNRAGQLMRVTADASTGFTTIVPGSEVILLGKNSTWENFNAFVDSTVNFSEPPAGYDPVNGYLQDFIASDSLSHTVGSLAFGLDGSLFVSIGDGASFNQTDYRGLRVQDVDSLSGKVLRIDPLTGQGLADNPFFNGDPDANRSKVYQLGLRNPWRLTVHPETGQLLIGETGWARYEEINAGGPGANFGWPYYEGAQGVNSPTPGYSDLPQAQEFYLSGAATPAQIALQHQEGSNTVVLGDVLINGDLGEEYEGDVFYNDLYRGIVRHANIDAEGNLYGVQIFTTEASFVVDIQQGPDGSLYYVNLFEGTVGKWLIV